jgi:digeranylgeranylglycerophospholipid reductase
VSVLKTDILIVGAGPAGLSAAEKAARLGANVLVIEKSTEIGFPVHTSGGSWIKDMKELEVPEKYYNPIRNVIFSSPNQEAEFSLTNTEACVLRIRPFYQFLASRAASQGAQISLATTAKLAQETKNRIVVKANKSKKTLTINAGTVIDSSGVSAVIGRSIGLSEKWNRVGIGAEYEAWVEKIDPSTSIFLIGKNAAPSGYAWIFPLDENKARIGVGILKPDSKFNPLDLLKRLLRKNVDYIQSLGRIVPIELHMGSTPADGPVPRSSLGRILLTGDAAGQVSPHVGEGIRFAMKFGKMAGEAAYSISLENDLTKSKEYDKKWKKICESKFKLALKFQKRLSTLSDASWDKGVEILRSLSPNESARLLKWDISRRFFFSLMAKHPRITTSSTMRMLLKFGASRKRKIS